jgi:hypothetical protein
MCPTILRETQLWTEALRGAVGEDVPAFALLDGRVA